MYSQFIVYRRSDKAPVSYRTGLPASAHDPINWMDVATAQATVASWGAEYGIGFVLTEAARIAVIDVDGCRNLQTGEISLIAQTLISMLPGAYVEISISGRGIHIWFTYSGVMPPHGSRAAGVGEFYHHDRYICIGAPYEAPGFTQGSLTTDHAAALPGLIAAFFPPGAEARGESERGEGPVPEWRGPTDDAELIRRAMNSKSTASAFGNRASFADLWLANEAALAVSYPDANGRPYDASAADAALAQHLAFWTGNDCERIERLMRQSGLVRDKYEREDYLPRTIQGAVGRQSDVLVDKSQPAALSALPPSLTVPSGEPNEYNPEDFYAHLPTHKYINRRTRDLMPEASLNGHLKRFSDGACQGMKPSAWLDQYRAVHQMSWQPNCPEIIAGKISIDGMLSDDPKGMIYNLYRPSDAVAMEGDPSPWVNHVRIMYPEEAEHIIKWMAYRIQNPGKKINHAIVMGGKPGIGKDLSLEVLRYGAGAGNFEDKEYKDLFGEYTAWAERTVLIINEARDSVVGKGIDRYAFYENSKRLIAAPPNTLPCRKLYLDQYYVPNVMAVVVTSNNKLNGLFIPPDDRRYFVAWSKMEPFEKPYYEALGNWMHEGKKIVFGYLQKLDLAGFDPLASPPKTEAWHQIVEAGVNPEEISFSDAIEGIQIATVREIIAALQFKGHMDLAISLQKNARKIPHFLEGVGMESLPNPHAKSGRWRLSDGRKETLYVDRNLPYNERMRLATEKAAKS